MNLQKAQNYEKKRNLVFVLTILFSTIYLLWRIFFTLPWSAGTLQMAAGIVLVMAETSTTLGLFELLISRMRSGNYTLHPPKLTKKEFPHVDVLIATHNEPEDLLYKTINACTFLEYPDRDKVHIYVCDDGNREEIRRLAEQLKVGYLGLKDNVHAKSGNYNNAIEKTDSPLIATFDADMIPRREFLIKTVPYFFIPGVRMGLVQTPQSFYNQDLFQFNLFAERDIPNEQDFFSREINVMRNSTNTAAYTGSNTLLSRGAMEEIGGFPYGTITEDFETSLRMQKAGYVTYATSEVLASGLSATTVGSMIGQRIRWARGVIQSIQNTNAVFTGKLSLSGRLSYLNAYLYWWSFFNRMVFILSPILFALFDFQLVQCGFGELLLFWLPSHLLSNRSMKYLSTNVRNLRWSQIIDTILAPYMILPVFLETFGIHQKKFKVTEKRKTSVKTTSARYIFPHAVLIVLTLTAIVRYAAGKYGMALLYSSVILFWLFYNLTALVYAVFFMLGRDSKRKHERIEAEEEIEIRVRGKEYRGRTFDVSEEGVSFRIFAEGGVETQTSSEEVSQRSTQAAEELYRKKVQGAEEEPILSSGECFYAVVRTQVYRANLEGRLVYGKREEAGFFYAAVVRPETEEDFKNWLQIIHDRAHSLPKEIDPWMTAYDDVVRNISYRYQNRRKEEK